MKRSKITLTSGILSMLLAAPVSIAFADDVTAKAILGGTPFAITNYGPNVVKGRAQLSSEGRSGAKVIAKLSGLKPGTAHIGHIHGGSCAQLFPGTILHNLEPIVADSAGKGVSKTSIPDSVQGLTDCEWWVAFHEGPTNTTPQTPAIAVGPVINKGNDHAHGHHDME